MGELREEIARRSRPTSAAIRAEIARRAEARTRSARASAARARLLPFIQHTHPAYSAGWFHEEVCRELERFSDEVARGLSPRLMLFAPPRHGKTAIVSQRWPVWHLGQHPGHEIVCASYGQELADDNSRAARSVARDEDAQEVFPGLKPVPDAEGAVLLDKVTHWKVGNGGSYKAVGIGGPLTGRGAHILIIDDPVKDQSEADSPAARKAAADWYGSVARTRLAPGGGVLLMMTRWHTEDLAGMLLDLAARDPAADQWRVVSYPALAEEDEPHRRRGEALHSARYPIPELVKIRATIGARKWTALYMQRPVAETGNMLKSEWFAERYRCRPEDIAQTADEVWVSVDAAKKPSGDADFHSILVWARKGGRYYLLDRRCERMGYPAFQLALDGMIAKWGPFLARGGAVLIEDTANGTTYLQMRRASSRVPLIDFSPNRDTPGADHSKQARAVYVQRAAEAGQVILPDPSVAPWVEEYLLCLTSFPLGAHDDDVDATSQLLMRWSLSASDATLDQVNGQLAALFGM